MTTIKCRMTDCKYNDGLFCHKMFLVIMKFKTCGCYCKRINNEEQADNYLFRCSGHTITGPAKGMEDNRKLQRTKRQVGSPYGGARRPTSPRNSLLKKLKEWINKEAEDYQPLI